MHNILKPSGDGREDSPGHSAKYGNYSLIELTCNKVVDFQLVQVCMILQTFVLILFSVHVYYYFSSNRVGGSYHMEKVGLVRALDFLKQHTLSVGVLVTERHRQIAVY